MKPTVVQGLTARPVPAGQELEAINNEVRPILEGVRAHANHRSEYRVSANTDDSPSAYKTIWESEAIPDDTAGTIEARVSGLDSAGFCCGYSLFYGYINDGGLAQSGAGTTFSFETAAAFDARITIVGTSVVLQVRDNGSPMKWEAVVSVLEVSR